MADDRPATKRDLEGLEARVKKDIGELEARLVERMRDMQTEILRGFEVVVKSYDARLRRVETGLLSLHSDDFAMNERLASVESRVGEIERKLLLHPPQ
jgi:hypothetical protein